MDPLSTSPCGAKVVGSPAPVDISNVQESLRRLRRSLATPELQEELPVKATGAQQAKSIQKASPGSTSDQEVSRLAQRLECMERAFLMSPTEAIRGHHQDAETIDPKCAQEGRCPELCAQFVEVLERGREARKRELSELENRLVARFTEAIECDKTARQKEVAELREALRQCQASTHERMVFQRSSTGGTTHRDSGVWSYPNKSAGTQMPEISPEVDTDVEAAMTTSKTALSQHVTELHRQLSEDLMEKLREALTTSTEVWESKLQVVNELLPHCSPIHTDTSGPNEQELNALGASLRRRVGQEEAQSNHQLHVQPDLSRIEVPMEQDPVKPILRSESTGHASAADIADESSPGRSPSVAPLHVRASAADIADESEGIPVVAPLVVVSRQLQPRQCPSSPGRNPSVAPLQVHASAADIADESEGLAVVAPLVARSILTRGVIAGHQSLQKLPSRLIALGEPLQVSQGFGPGCH